jgi:hypothetical protein
MRHRSVPIALVLGFASLLGCAPRDQALPEEFPPVRLGMDRAEARAALERAGGGVVEDNEQMVRVVGRDRRVHEEFFLFYKGRLAAFILRYPGMASRGVFQRQSRRFDLSFGKPFEQRDDGIVMTSRWRAKGIGGQVLLSAFVGGRGEAPLMVRVEDPSVLGRLIRQLGTDSL